MSTGDSARYFKITVEQYFLSDLDELLKQTKSAGPLLQVVVNAIDNLGGILYDFKTGSKMRSTKFMTEKMGIPEKLSKFLYHSVRSGVIHEGMPKYGLYFFRDEERLRKNHIFYKDMDYLYVNVTELAYRLKDTLKVIQHEEKQHFPSFQVNEANKFQGLLSSASAEDINILLSEYDEKHSEPMASCAARDFEGTFRHSSLIVPLSEV